MIQMIQNKKRALISLGHRTLALNISGCRISSIYQGRFKDKWATEIESWTQTIWLIKELFKPELVTRYLMLRRDCNIVTQRLSRERRWTHNGKF